MALSNLYFKLKQYNGLYEGYRVLLKQLEINCENVTVQMHSIRKHFILYRWCLRNDLSIPFPIVNKDHKMQISDKQKLFYCKFSNYLRNHPIELAKIILSISKVNNKRENYSIKSLYLNHEMDLAEAVCFDIMNINMDSLAILMGAILSETQNLSGLSQNIFQVFIFIACHKVLNTKFRDLMNRLYKTEEALSFQKVKGNKQQMLSSKLYIVCCDVLSVVISVLRALPTAVKQSISTIKKKISNSPSQLLQWLLSTIFLPLLTKPEDWYLVMCNPPNDVAKNNNNIQCIVTALFEMSCSYQHNKNYQYDAFLSELLLEKYGSPLKNVLTCILNETSANVLSTETVNVSIVTPELIIWHRIFLKIENSIISTDLQNLCKSLLPLKIPNRPWFTFPIMAKQLIAEQLIFDDEKKCIDQDDKQTEKYVFQHQTSKYLSEYTFKAIHEFIMSLSDTQASALTSDIFDINYKGDMELEFEQYMLLNEGRSHLAKENINVRNVDEILRKVADEYVNNFFNNSFLLSTQNVIFQTQLKKMRKIAAETHANLQIKDILKLAKSNINVLLTRLTMIRSTVNTNMSNTPIVIDDSDWMNDRFVSSKNTKIISKTRNALVKFLNDFGIGKVDFKGKFGGQVLKFEDKRIASILHNALIFEICDVFWCRGDFEDNKFTKQLVQLADKFQTFDKFRVFAQKCFLKETDNAVKFTNTCIPTHSMNRLIIKFQEINIVDHLTLAHFEDVLSKVYQCVCDNMLLLCYIIMKAVPTYLPSQLQTCKIISQRKKQDDYFIYCVRAMQNLRFFWNQLYGKQNVGYFISIPKKDKETKKILENDQFYLEKWISELLKFQMRTTNNNNQNGIENENEKK
eukprot:472432_1